MAKNTKDTTTKGKRGRPGGINTPHKDSKRRSAMPVHIQVSQDERDAMRQLAALEGVTLSALIRERVLGPGSPAFALRVWRTTPDGTVTEHIPTDYFANIPTQVVEFRDAEGAMVQVMIGSSARQLAAMYRQGKLSPAQPLAAEALREPLKKSPKQSTKKSR